MLKRTKLLLVDQISFSELAPNRSSLRLLEALEGEAKRSWDLGYHHATRGHNYNDSGAQYKDAYKRGFEADKGDDLKDGSSAIGNPAIIKKMKFHSWKKPDSDEESGEIARAADEEGLDAKKLTKLIDDAPITKLSDKDWSELQNTDSWDTETMDDVKRLSKEHGRNYSRVVRGFTLGGEMPASIIFKRKDGSSTLIGGNTRLMVARALGVRPRVVIAKESDLNKGKDSDEHQNPDWVRRGF